MLIRVTKVTYPNVKMEDFPEDFFESAEQLVPYLKKREENLNKWLQNRPFFIEHNDAQILHYIDELIWESIREHQDFDNFSFEYEILSKRGRTIRKCQGSFTL